MGSFPSRTPLTRRLIRWVFALIGSTLVLVSDAEAARFVASLTSIKTTAHAGQVQTHQYLLTLDKNEKKPARFKFHVEDWWRSEDGRQSYYAAPGSLRRSCGGWVSVNPVEAVAQPGATLSARVTVTVPREVGPGGYWCVLTVDELPDPLEAPTGVGAQFVGSVSTGIFVYIDPVDRAVEFTGVHVGTSEALVKLENRGNAPVGVEGRFEFVRPGETEPVATLSFPRGTLLPEPIATAIFGATLPSADVLPSGQYIVRVVVDIGLDHEIGVEHQIDLIRDISIPLRR